MIPPAFDRWKNSDCELTNSEFPNIPGAGRPGPCCFRRGSCPRSHPSPGVRQLPHPPRTWTRPQLTQEVLHPGTGAPHCSNTGAKNKWETTTKSRRSHAFLLGFYPSQQVGWFLHVLHDRETKKKRFHSPSEEQQVLRGLLSKTKGGALFTAVLPHAHTTT